MQAREQSNERTQAMLNAFFDWDVVNWSKALPLWSSALPEQLHGKCAVEIGARSGGLALWLALRGARVVSGHFRGEAEQARSLHLRYGVSDRVSYEQIDVTSLGHECEFDVVVMKSVLGGVGAFGRQDRQQLAVREIYKALRPGGIFLFAENLRSTRLHDLVRRTKRGETWRYPTVEEFSEMLGVFDEVAWQTHGFLGMFGFNERQRTALGRVDGWLCPVLPARFRYLMYGVARKSLH